MPKCSACGKVFEVGEQAFEATAAIHQHLTAGATGVTRLMHGNLAGTVGRALFCTAFALSIDPELGSMRYTKSYGPRVGAVT